MKKLLIFIIAVLSFIPFTVKAETKKITLHLFYNVTCSHCEALIKWLNTDYLKNNKDIIFYKYEITKDFGNSEKFLEAQSVLNKPSNNVPYLIIGNQVIIGFDEKITPNNIKTIIKYYRTSPYRDLVGEKFGLTKVNDTISMEDINVLEKEYTIPIFGKVDPKNVSLPVVSAVIGAVDGFNPCAMWILIFLITMLFGMKDRKKMWILGLSFLFISALVYMMFMVSWLSLASFLNKISIIKILIGLFALIFGTFNIRSYIKSLNKDAGCEVVDDKKRKTIMTQIKKIVTEKSFILALIGIIILSVSVNLIELLCSLGLPVLFTQILSMNDLTGFQYSIYIIIYLIFFMLDDFIIFFIAMKTMKIKGISNRYTKYSHLIGGIIMLIIGLLMIFKPEWLMFNF